MDSSGISTKARPCRCDFSRTFKRRLALSPPHRMCEFIGCWSETDHARTSRRPLFCDLSLCALRQAGPTHTATDTKLSREYLERDVRNWWALSSRSRADSFAYSLHREQFRPPLPCPLPHGGEGVRGGALSLVPSPPWGRGLGRGGAGDCSPRQWSITSCGTNTECAPCQCVG